MSRRLNALVIGNAAYKAVAKLKNPVNDAQDIAGELSGCGFTVIQESDSSYADMDRALKRFQNVLKESDVGLFFFAGHGMQIDGDNYLAAVDTDGTDEITAKHSSLALNRIIEVMEKSVCSTSIIVLDACRSNPFERAWTRSVESRGLAPVYAPRGTLIAFATSPGQSASDGRGRNGAYTSALLQHLTTPDCSIETMFKRVRNTLNAATGGQQISWEHTSLAGEFHFNLSLGVRIDLYAETSLSDCLFVLDDSKTSHRIIRDLKSLTWPRQNPAVVELTPMVANKASLNSLFVLGRNIYQAACGGSNEAMAYLKSFSARSKGIVEEKRKALLDGMLFEVFYNSNAKLRESFKLRAFSELFELQRYKEFQSSFDFMAECLLPESGRFYSIPGKGHEVVIDVITSPGPDGSTCILESVHCSGDSVLWLEDEDFSTDPHGNPMREKLSIPRFEQHMVEQMVVPKRLLTIKYPAWGDQVFKHIAFPLGWTARKR